MENLYDNLPSGDIFLASYPTNSRNQSSVHEDKGNVGLGTVNGGNNFIPPSNDHSQGYSILGENKRLKAELENAQREIRKHEDQLKTAQELIETQRKYVQEVEMNVHNLRQIENDNESLIVELEEERKLRTNADNLAIELQRLILKFENVPEKASQAKASKEKALKVLGLEAKLASRSTEDDAIFDANIEVIHSQMHNFLGLVKTSLSLIKNHQKERRDEIESIVRKLVSCCHGNSFSEGNVEENSDTIDLDEKIDVDTFEDANDDIDTSVNVKNDIQALNIAGDDGNTSGEDTSNRDTYADDGLNESGVSCFDVIDLDEESETINDSLTFTPRKSIRERRRSVNLRDFAVPRKTLEIHEDQKDFHVEEIGNHLTKKNDRRRKRKKMQAQKQGSVSDFDNAFPCKLCKRKFRTAGKLKRHIKSHNVNHIAEDLHSKRKICYKCGQFFPTKELLDCHHEEHHKGDMPNKNIA